MVERERWLEESSGPAGPPTVTQHASFTGTGREYFGIWIVNLALSVVTLGVYSAWAKVRRQQYFFRHTHFAGASFDYHGQPLAILKGRIIAFTLFALYTGSGFISPLMTLVVIGLIGLVMPWLLVRSLKFQLWNTSYRGLRFRFVGTTKDAYRTCLGYGLLTLVTLGFAAPLFYQRLKRYQHSHAQFGQSAFTFSATVADVYKIVFGVFLAWIVVISVFGMMFFGIVGVAAQFDTAGGEAQAWALAILVPMIVMTALLYVASLIILNCLATARLRNLLWTATAIGPHQVRSDLDVLPFVRVELVNVILTLLTFGLFRPFAVVRRARLMVEAVSVDVVGDLSEFEAGDQEHPGAVGDEIADIFDFDVAF